MINKAGATTNTGSMGLPPAWTTRYSMTSHGPTTTAAICSPKPSEQEGGVNSGAAAAAIATIKGVVQAVALLGHVPGGVATRCNKSPHCCCYDSNNNGLPP